MKAGISEIPHYVLQQRKRTGADRWDEMWEGVLHIAPAPNKRHTRLQVQFHNWLEEHWGIPGGNQVDLLINVASVGGWPHDYRIPDIVLLTPDRFSIDCEDYYNGAPPVVIEIRSPGDETLDKMDFYARLGVPEVWVIDRDTRMPQILQLAAGEYRELPAMADCWRVSPLTSVWLRQGDMNKLELQLGDNLETWESLPRE
jgi:Uma2 family endonuclease